MANNIWLALTSLNNWEIIKENNIYGIKNYVSANKLSNNDILIIYVIPKRLGGFFEVKERYHVKKIEFQGDNYVFQFKIKPKKIFDKLIIINDKSKKYEIVENLSIFKNKKHWGSVLMGRDLIALKRCDYIFLSEVLKNE